MEREAVRTLHSLSHHYQRGVDDLDYEVIAVDNGSDLPLDAEMVAMHGPYFRSYRIEKAHASPARAINFGVAQARGEFVAIMIDGAHILTPGVLKYFTLATRCYSHPIVAVRGWFVGRGQQGVTLDSSYDQTVEDRLFAKINWPENGYRLFEVGELIGMRRRNWFSAIKESNCLFVRRAIFDSIGGANEAFDLPGGGFLNLDLLKECTKAPDANLVSIIGEGSFHQFHGGTTTNGDISQRKDMLATYRAQYEEIRGEPFSLPSLPVEYVGRMNQFARLHLPPYLPPEK